MAFDRIFLGHQHRQILPEMQIPGAKDVVIWKRMLDQPQAGTPQMIEKTPRIANAGYRVHGALPKTDQRRRDAGIVEIERDLTAQ